MGCVFLYMLGERIKIASSSFSVRGFCENEQHLYYLGMLESNRQVSGTYVFVLWDSVICMVFGVVCME